MPPDLVIEIPPGACTNENPLSVTFFVTFFPQTRHTRRNQMQSHRWLQLVDLSSESSCLGVVGEGKRPSDENRFQTVEDQSLAIEVTKEGEVGGHTSGKQSPRTHRK